SGNWPPITCRGEDANALERYNSARPLHDAVHPACEHGSAGDRAVHAFLHGPPRRAGAAGPVVFDSNLSVRTVVSGLQAPVTMAFLGANDFLITEKATGRVKRIVN